MATLVAPSNHSPKEDAEALWKAVKGTHYPTIYSFSLVYVDWNINRLNFHLTNPWLKFLTLDLQV